MTTSDQATRREALEAVILRHHGVELAEVMDLIGYLRDAEDSVIAGGSLALGLGNGLSDLDVVVSGGESTESSRIPLEHWVKSLRVDVWKLAQPDIDELFERAERLLGSEEPVLGAFGDIYEETDLKLLHRVAFGIQLDGPPLQPSEMRDYHVIARDLLVSEYAERVRESAFVAQLALASGDVVGAGTNARLAVQSALHATITAKGLAFTGDKWLRDRLDIDQPELASIHESFMTLPGEEDGAGEFVRAALETCQRLTGRDLSIAAEAPQARWEAGDLSLVEVGRERFLLSLKQDGLWELDEDETETWRGFDGSETLSFDGSDEAAMRLCFELYALGLIKLRWTVGLPIDELAFGNGGPA